MSIINRLIEPKTPLPQERRLFSSGDLRRMIIPLVIEQMLQMVVGIADTLMVTYAGEATVSGVSLDTMIYIIFIYLFTAVATGGAVVVSQYLGSKDRNNADLAASQIFMMSGALSLGCVALVLLGGNLFLRTLYPSVEPEVMDACQVYLRIVAYSFPANAIYNAGAAVYRSMGKTRATMLVTTAMNLINVVGNAIGIFVLHAGAAGVAWPTTISWYFAAVVMTILCLNKKNEVTVRPKLVFRVVGQMDRRVLHVAVPNAIENVLFQAAKVALGALVATFGTSQIAANGIGQTLWSLSACMSVSMSPVFITVVGRCMGAGDPEAADWYMNHLTRLDTVLSFGWNILFLLLMPLVIPLYSITPETTQLVWIIVIIHAVGAAFIHPIAFPLSAGLRAAGDVKFTMWAAILCTVGIRTAFSFLLGLGFGLGVIGIALAMVIDWIFKGALDVWRWRSGKWKQHKLI